MYYTGRNPLTGQSVYVARRHEDKEMQRALMQYYNPANYDIVYKALCLAGRRDLIGYSTKCLIPLRRRQSAFQRGKTALPDHRPRRPVTKGKKR
jgi:hypothetical protein